MIPIEYLSPSLVRVLARILVLLLLVQALPACPRKSTPPPPEGLVLRDDVLVPTKLLDLPIAVTKGDLRRLREKGNLQIGEVKESHYSKEFGTVSSFLRRAKVSGPDGLRAEISFADGIDRMTAAWVRMPSERRELAVHYVPTVGWVLFERYRLSIDANGAEGTPRMVDTREHWDPFPALKARLDRATDKDKDAVVSEAAGYTSRFGAVDMRLFDAALAKYAGNVDARNMLWLRSCNADFDVPAGGGDLRPAPPEVHRKLQEAMVPRIAQEKDGWLVSHALTDCLLFDARYPAVDLARPVILRLAAMACAAKSDVEFNRASDGVVRAVKPTVRKPSESDAAAVRKAAFDGLDACPAGPFKTKLAERIAP